ncbi:hypothetical protein MKZ38_004770 [Zalerion maritima]|uniref:NADP-dependent oxidoreductase domain-containing protein n=1 Tax=Zalerion maritima TaxID=339359 RepID=A0AAD5RL71_9PEZI|nr:hypothetical protein MKZ38_004770 [Zalerion maritima]
MPAQNVPLHKLGRDGPSVPALGLGLMPLSHEVYGSVMPEEDQLAFLDRACELGATFWDSADLYGGSEALIGKWFKRTGKRSDIFLATKFGFVKGSPSLAVDSSGEYCKTACAESLRLLETDCIDLCHQPGDPLDYMHHADTKTPIEQTMRALKELQEEGKIKHIGLSSISSKTLRRAYKIAPVAAVQVEYSPFVLDCETEAGTNLLAACRELGVAVVTACPLGRGILTSTYAKGGPVGDEKDMRSKVMPRFMEGNRDKNTKLVAKFQDMAERKGCTVSQLALAWLLKQGDDIFPIPGTKRIKYMEENWGALLVKLSDEEDAEVRNFVEKVEIAGSYMPPKFEAYIYRDTPEEGAVSERV